MRVPPPALAPPTPPVEIERPTTTLELWVAVGDGDLAPAASAVSEQLRLLEFVWFGTAGAQPVFFVERSLLD